MYKILITEDNGDLANVYKLKFEQEGFEVRVVNDGSKCMDAIREFKPDIVLLDIMLPNMDGFKILAEIKTDPDLKHIPVIVWTNLSEEQDVQKIKDMGADDYLLKVLYMPQEVVEKVKKKIEEKEEN